MDLDTGQPARQMGHQPGDPAHARLPQPVRQPVKQHGVEPGIAGDDLPGIPGRRVTLEYDCDFFFQAREHYLYESTPGPRTLRCPSKLVNLSAYPFLGLR